MSKSAVDYAQQAQELCVLSDVYIQLNEMLSRDDCSMEQLSDAIAYEPAIAASLLKLANSAMFNMPRQVDNLARALVLLGLKEVKQLVSAYGVTAAFAGVNPDVADMDRFWEISVDCALICQHLAKAKQSPYADSIFLSGLFHNLGMLAMVHSEPQKVKYCESYDREETPWERQQNVFGFRFSDCGAELLKLWSLPDAIVRPITEFNRQDVIQLAEDSSILYIASRLAVMNADPSIYAKQQIIDPAVLKKLGLTKQDLKDALAYCNEQAMELLATFPIQRSA